MTTDIRTKAVVFTAGALGLIAIAVGLALFNAVVLQVMWGWFVVPMGAPAIGLAHAYGLTLLLTLFRRFPDKSEDLSWVTKRIVANLFALLLGWIAQGFM